MYLEQFREGARLPPTGHQGNCGTLFGPRQQNHCTVEMSSETPEIPDLFKLRRYPRDSRNFEHVHSFLARLPLFLAQLDIPAHRPLLSPTTECSKIGAMNVHSAATPENEILLIL